MTAAIRKIFFREVRNTLGWYPNWPVNNTIDLGLIGKYHGRRAEFTWVKTLQDFGITIQAPPAQGILTELVTSIKGVKIDFSSAPNNTYANAAFKFSKKYLFAAQGIDLYHKRLNIDALQSQLLTGIANGSIKWKPDWVIVTSLFESSSFSTLISASKGSQSVISTSTPQTTPVFNIADPNLGLHISSSSDMAYQAIATSGVKPYFQVHRLKQRNGIFQYLARYAAGSYQDILGGLVLEIDE